MKDKFILLIIILAIIPLFDLFNNGLPVTHDGIDHVARIANFYNSLLDGMFFPRWAENLNSGYGHPVMMFLYPFSSYAAALVHFLGFSFVDSLKIIFGLGFIASGLTMYLWAREQFNNHVAFVASILYIYAPYRFIDLYVRGAIGEHMAFIFPPLVLFFILKSFEEKNITKSKIYNLGLGISFMGLLLAHNAISLMFLPFFATYILFQMITTRKYKRSILIFIYLILGFFASGFFTIPAFFEGKYTLRDIVTGDDYRTRFIVNPLNFLFGKWNYGITGQFSVQLGFAQLILLSFAPFLIIKRKLIGNRKMLFYIILAFFVLSIFLQIPASDFFYNLFSTLKKFQFPWRFLSLSVFMLSIVSALGILLIGKRFRIIFIIFILIITLISTSTFWKAKEYKLYSDTYFNQIYKGTTDTGESSPIWSVRFMEKTRSKSSEVIDGDAKIIEMFRTSVLHKYRIEVLSNNARIRENTLYFPGWQVLANGKMVDIEFQDALNRGLITYRLNKGVYLVDIVFKNTKLRTFSNITSIIAVILMVLLLIVPYFNRRSNEK